jgi:hypothetical protein
MNFMAIHDDNWTNEFKKPDVAVKALSTMPLIWFIVVITILYNWVPLIYNVVVSNPTEAIRFSLVSGGIVILSIGVKAALKLYVRDRI